MPETEAHLQFCADGRDITGDFYASDDATEVRAWSRGALCLGAVTRGEDGRWRASASEVCDWTEHTDAYEGWRAALAALLALTNNHRAVPESEWR